MLYVLFVVIDRFVSILEGLIVIDALLSWIMPPRRNRFSRILGIVIDPILEPCYKIQKKFLPNVFVDFSPVIAIFILEIVRNILRIILRAGL